MAVMSVAGERDDGALQVGLGLWHWPGPVCFAGLGQARFSRGGRVCLVGFVWRRVANRPDGGIDREDVLLG